MLEYRMRLVAAAMMAVMSASWAASANTGRLDQEQQWKEISAERRDSFLLALAASCRRSVGIGPYNHL